MKTKHVYLGRFAPFHNGHKRLLQRLIDLKEQENVLVLVGSSNALNRRTPYTYEDRAEIIRFSFPDVEVLPLPDGKPDLEYFDGDTNGIWLDNIEKIAKERDESFIFYGGSPLDLEVLAERFETKILVDRHAPEERMSATEIRELIKLRKRDEIARLVDPKALEKIINNFKAL